jgi:hypothetical protein
MAIAFSFLLHGPSCAHFFSILGPSCNIFIIIIIIFSIAHASFVTSWGREKPVLWSVYFRVARELTSSAEVACLCDLDQTSMKHISIGLQHLITLNVLTSRICIKC